MRPLTFFAPVQPEMELVNRTISAAASVDPPWLSQLLGHVLGDAGKRLRPAVTLLSGKLFRDDLENVIPMAAGIELLHTATLIHDDAIDESEVRRGRPTLSTVCGARNAILVGDYLFAKSAELVATTNNPRVIRLFARTVMTICTGELEQDFATEQGQRQAYIQRIGNKTASLFSAAAQAGAILGQGPEEAVAGLDTYGYNLGLAFQIVDDILDFVGQGEEMGKPVRSDLFQGTLTLPAIMLMEKRPQDNPVSRILNNQQREKNMRLALKEIASSSIIPDCYRIAQDFAVQASRALERLPSGQCRQALHDLMEYTVQRRA